MVDKVKWQSLIACYGAAVPAVGGRHEWIRRVGLALLAPVVAFWVRQWLIPTLEPGLAFITFHAAVMLAAVFGGFWCGLFATAFSALLSIYFILPPGAVTRPSLGLSLFCLNGVIMSAVAALYRRAQNRVADYERERARRESERRVADILDNITDGFHVIDANWRFVHFNEAARKLFAAHGIDAGTLVGKHVFEAFPDAAENHTGRALWRTMTERVPTEAENVYVPWQRWFATRHYPTAEGGVSTFFQDITERKRGEIALRDSEERYRTIFETAEVSLWEEDFSDVERALDELKTGGVADFRAYFEDHPEFIRQAIAMVKIHDVNETTLRMFGARDKRELLESLHRIFLPETEKVFVEELLAVADKSPSIKGETVLRTLQNRPLHVIFTITFSSSAKPLDRVLVSLMDISERNQAEETLRHTHEELQAYAEELTRFNRAAVGRELRMIELKKEVNELCGRLGWAPRYLPEFGNERKESHLR